MHFRILNTLGILIRYCVFCVNLFKHLFPAFQINCLDSNGESSIYPEQRAILVTEYHHNNGSIRAVLKVFWNQFPDVCIPSRRTVSRNVRKSNEDGMSHNLNKHRSGRRHTARTEENIQAVQDLSNNNQPDGEIIISACRNGLGLSSATFNRITRLDLQFYPYQMIRRHQLWAQNTCFLENVIIGDKAGFSLNAHNVRHYAPQGQQPVDFQFQHNDDHHKITVWVGLSSNDKPTSCSCPTENALFQPKPSWAI